MKRRLSFIVLTVEILAITVLHAVKLNHSETNNSKTNTQLISKQPEFRVKENYTAISYIK